MSLQFSSGRMEFELDTLTSTAPVKAREGTPFCIGILGDFSGRSNRGICEMGPSPAARRRVPVDVDDFEHLPGKLAAEIHIPVGGEDGPCIAIPFYELDDFHPDRIFDRLEIFQRLKLIRGRLQDPATFGEAASEVRRWAAGEPDKGKMTGAGQAEGSSAEGEESDSDTLERLLGKKPGPGQRPTSSRASVDIDGLIREVVKPYIVPAPHPQQAEVVAQVDRAISGQMRAILHHPDFQAVEAAWRMLHFLVSRLETDETLKLYAVDVSKGELAADLASAEHWQSSGTYRFVVEQSVGVQGAEPWALLVGCYMFDQTEEDLVLLRQLGRVGQAGGAPFLAAAGSHFAGCESIAATPDPDGWRWRGEPGAAGQWDELRCSPEARYIGLVLPRFLLRLPYGRDTERLERFDFEELSGVGDQEGYLWGNGAAICAYLLGEAFREFGWSLTGGLGRDVRGLAMHVYRSGGEKRVTPCAETFLTERAMQVLLDKGLMPLLSVKGQDAVRIPRFQSVAEPAAALAGRWK